jgi:hypothetical protein
VQETNVYCQKKRSFNEVDLTMVGGCHVVLLALLQGVRVHMMVWAYVVDE